MNVGGNCHRAINMVKKTNAGQNNSSINIVFFSGRGKTGKNKNRKQRQIQQIRFSFMLFGVLINLPVVVFLKESCVVIKDVIV